MLLLVLIFISLYIYLAWQKESLALMFLLASLPTYLIRFKIFNIPSTLLEFMILSLFFVWLIKDTKFIEFITGKYTFSKWKKERKEKDKYPFALELFLILISAFIASSISNFNQNSIGILKAYFIEPAFVFILVFNIFQGKNKISKIVFPLFLSAFLISILAIIQKINGLWILNEFWAQEATRRVTSFFPYPNALALFLGPIILLMFGYLLEYKKNKLINLFLILNIILSCLAIYFAKSTGAIIGVISGCLFFLFIFNKFYRYLILSLLGLFLILFLFFEPFNYQIQKIYTKPNLSLEIRKLIWKETLTMLKDNRLISGAGLANYQNSIRPYHSQGIFFNKENDPDFKRKIIIFNDKYKKEHWQPVEIYLYPHNIILNFWSELGLFGLMCFVILIFKFFYYGFKLLAKEKNKFIINSLMASMFVILTHGLVDVPYFKNDLAILFWLIIALMGIIKLKFEYEKK